MNHITATKPTTPFALGTLSLVTFLIGLNDLVPARDTQLDRVWLTKVGHLPDWDTLHKNGELLGPDLSPDILIDAGRAPEPDPDFTLGVERVGKSPAKRLEANRLAVAELDQPAPDRDILAGYSGGGGLGESVDAYYTPKQLSLAMWDMLAEELKFRPDSKTRPRVIDPTCGTGGLLAYAPKELELTGVEFDEDAARIAQALMPHAAIYAMPFESFTTRSSAELFDAAILNPPYGPRGLTAHLHEPKEKRSEAYILLQTIRRVKHGGLICALLPLSLLHGSAHAGLRARLLNMATPLHAAIVPDSAFEDAGAGVTTVLLLLRRHDVGVEEMLGSLEGGAPELVQLFSQNSAQRKLISDWVRGESIVTTTHHASGHKDYALATRWDGFRAARAETISVGGYGQPIYKGELEDYYLTRISEQAKASVRGTPPVTARLMLEHIRTLHGNMAAERAKAAAKEAHLHAIPDGTVRGRFVFAQGAWKPHENFSEPLIAQAADVAQGLHFYLAARDLSRPEAQNLRAEVLNADSAYRARFGAYPVSRLRRLGQEYALLHLLLEHLKDGALHLPEQDLKPVTLTSSGKKDIAEELADLMMLSEDTLSQYAGISVDEAVQHLSQHFAFNGNTWVEPSTYYWGHAKVRSDEARAKAETVSGPYSASRKAALLRQADAFLSLVVPAKWENMRLSPRDPIIPTHIMTAWVNDFLGSVVDGKPVVRFERQQGTARLVREGGLTEEGFRAAAAFDQERAGALEAFLNFKTELERMEGASEMSREEKAAARAVIEDKAQAYQDEVLSHWNNWVTAQGVTAELEEAYTWTRGANIKPKGSTRPLVLPDWQGPTPHPYQAGDTRVFAAMQGGINNYDVGVGKTYAMLLLIAYLKRCGQAQRPIIVVPATLIPNWAVNAARALPSWNVLVIGMTARTDKEGQPVYKQHPDGSVMCDQSGQPIQAWREDNAEVKKAKLAQMSAGRHDLIIMSQDTYTALGMFRDTRRDLILSDPQYQYQLAVQEKYEKSGFQRRNARQQLIREIGLFNAMMKDASHAADGEISFELLGADFIGIDEGHSVKNVYGTPTIFGRTPKYLGGGEKGSQRATEALHKNRYVRARGGKTYLFTASWLKNSPMEIYSMLSQVTDDLPQYGLLTQEVLMENYLRIEPDIWVNDAGEVTIEQCVMGFKRIQELKGIISGYVVSRTYSDPEVVKVDGSKLDVPQVKDEEVLFDMTPEQAEVFAELRAEAVVAAQTGRGANRSGPHPFEVMWKMRKLTVDPALMGVEGRNPRFEKVAELALENRRDGHKAIVFMSIGSEEGSFERLRGELIARGYPAGEIAIVTSKTHKTKVSRQNLEDDYNFGHLTLILGTDVLQQGFNLQYGTGMIIHTDVPWNFEEIRQRTGRGARQGNVLASVRNVYLLMRGSFDQKTYTIMNGKKAWQQEIWGDKDELDNTNRGFSGEEMALLLSDDPEATKVQIDKNRDSLLALTQQAKLRRNLETLIYALDSLHSLRSSLRNANGRKSGWTAHDHTLITNKRALTRRKVMDVQRLEHFPFARLLDYKGDIYIRNQIPVHIGMQLSSDENTWEVIGYDDDKGLMELMDPSGETSVMHVKDIRYRKLNISPSPHEEHYEQEEGLFEQRATLSWQPGAAVRILDPRAVQRLVPDSSQSGVMTIHMTADSRISLLEHPVEFTVRALLNRGDTILHVVTEPNGSDLAIKGVAVMSLSPKRRENFTRLSGDPEFQRKLASIAAGCIGAELKFEQPRAKAS